MKRLQLFAQDIVLKLPSIDPSLCENVVLAWIGIASKTIT